MMYDLAILGAGPGGYVAASRAGKAGLSVVLFEGRELGGVCLNEGCIPTKTLLYSAKLLHYAQEGGKYGLEVPEASLDIPAVFRRKDKIVKKLTGAVRVQMRDAGVEVVKEFAVIRGKASEGFVIAAGEAVYEAKNVLICTGSSAVVPPIPGLREGLSDGVVVTSRELLSAAGVPQKLVVIGGGVIGMELAGFFNAAGTEVTVIEMLPKILGPMDAELSALLQAQYEKKGVTFHLSCKVTAVEGNEVVFEDASGTVSRAAGDRILCCVGRRANLEGIGLESIGAELTERPRGIRVDAQMRSSVPGVFAAGDVTGFSMLAHTASREGEVAVNTILGIPDEMAYNAVPGVVYTQPEVAGVGLTEEEASARGIEVTVKKLPLAYAGRFVAENERGEGLCKILVGEGEKVLGVHILGTPASEIISAACVAVARGLTVSELKKVILPHPTVAEILKETLFGE